jgi:hypothetical protein
MRRMLTIAALAVLAVSAMWAQNVVTPDRETLLREVGIAHGMLRGLQYADATTTAQYQATGTQYIVGQAFKPGAPWPAARLTKYNVWVNYAVPGIRIELERTNPEGPVRANFLIPARCCDVRPATKPADRGLDTEKR